MACGRGMRMMTEATIRQATSADISEMAQIIFDWESATEWVPDTYSLQESEDFIREVMPDREMWVAGSPIKGYLSFNPRALRVGMLYCSERGSGIGKSLLDHVKKGRDFIWLTTQERNLAAQKFYRREGFSEIEGVEVEASNALPEIRMEWRA